MSITEFSNEFNTLLASHQYEVPFGTESFIQDLIFDDYEKSVFLTLAQEQLVIAYYNGTAGSSFESSEELRRYLDRLVITATLDPVDTDDQIAGNIFELPNDLWYIVYESAATSGGGCFASSMDVLPITHDTFNKIKGNPFRGITDRRALRLDCGNNRVELVSKSPVTVYTIRYVKQPSPIILVPLEDDVKINGSQNPSTCQLHPALHRKILELAVQLAIQSKVLKGSSK